MTSNEKNSKLVTLDDLAVMIKNGFDNTATKQAVEALGGSLNTLDKKVDKLEKKVDKIDERLQTVETKLDRALYTELVFLETRLRRVEEKVGIKSAKPFA